MGESGWTLQNCGFHFLARHSWGKWSPKKKTPTTIVFFWCVTYSHHVTPIFLLFILPVKSSGWSMGSFFHPDESYETLDTHYVSQLNNLEWDLFLIVYMHVITTSFNWNTRRRVWERNDCCASCAAARQGPACPGDWLLHSVEPWLLWHCCVWTLVMSTKLHKSLKLPLHRSELKSFGQRNISSFLFYSNSSSNEDLK